MIYAQPGLRTSSYLSPLERNKVCLKCCSLGPWQRCAATGGRISVRTEFYNIYVFCALFVTEEKLILTFSSLQKDTDLCRPGSLQICFVKPQLGSGSYLAILFFFPIDLTNSTVTSAGEVGNSAWSFQRQLPGEVILKLNAKI